MHPTRRAAVFAFADKRGNNPHGTRETYDHEGRRRNAQRYETVGQMDRALDPRSRPRQIALQLGEGPPSPSPAPSNIFSALLLIAVGAAIAYVATRPDEVDEAETQAPRPNPAPAQPAALPPAAPPAAPAAVVVVATQPAPVTLPPVIAIEPVTARTARRRRKKAEAAAPPATP